MFFSFFKSKESSQKQAQMDALKGALVKGNIDEKSQAKILDNASSLSERCLQAAVGFITATTVEKSKREEYYTHSKHLAEFFCTISNAGLFYVAYQYKDYTTLFAATFSALSHAIPSQRLHDMDMIGCYAMMAKVLDNYKVLLGQPDVAKACLGALSLNGMDTLITRRFRDTVGPWFHVAWHIGAAYALYMFNEGLNAANEADKGLLYTAYQDGVVPEFLQTAYNEISTAISDALYQPSGCGIM